MHCVKPSLAISTALIVLESLRGEELLCLIWF
jgi:hypothetical protein